MASLRDRMNLMRLSGGGGGGEGSLPASGRSSSGANLADMGNSLEVNRRWGGRGLVLLRWPPGGALLRHPPCIVLVDGGLPCTWPALLFELTIGTLLRPRSCQLQSLQQRLANLQSRRTSQM
jgi:hypothetical protein